MSEIRLVSSSDEHLADISPGFRKDDYKSAILGKLEWQGELARRVGADAVIRAGDFFHIKPANKTTMATVARSADIHRKYPCPIYVIAGNHDLSQNDLESLPRQPLGVMMKSEVFYPLKNELFASGSLRVRVIGVNYTTDLDYDGLKELVSKQKDDEYVIAVIHALAAHAPTERIQSFFGEKIFDYRDLVYRDCPDVYIFGHYHKDQGVMNHCGTQFVNLGAIARGALTFEDIDRRPKVAVITCNSQGISIEVCDVPCGDASAVFDLERKQQLEKERQSLDDFISQLYSNTVFAADGGIRDRMAALRGSDYPDDLKKIVMKTLEEAEAGLVDT